MDTISIGPMGEGETFTAGIQPNRYYRRGIDPVVATPGGSDTQVQYNDSGSLGGESAFTYNKTTNKVSLAEDLGSELAPALTTGNWTLGTGWAFGTSPNTLQKTGNGTTSTTGFTPTANTRYRVVITFSSFTAGVINNLKMGGFSFVGTVGADDEASAQNPIITAAGTYTYEFYTLTTGAFTFQNDNASRFVISAISIKAVTASTGQASIDGDITSKGALRFNDTLISPVIKYEIVSGANRNDLSVGGARPRFLQFILGTSVTITGLNLNQEDGQECYLINFSSGGNITLPHQDTGSQAQNRFQTPTSANMVMEYGSVVYARYNGGNLNRWFLTKIGSGSGQWNGLTNGAIFGDYLNTLISNANPLYIYAGNRAQLNLIDDPTYTSKIGDAQTNGNRTRGVWDDLNSLIGMYLNGTVANSEFTIWDENDTKKAFQLKAGNGSFNTRETDLNSRTLIVDSNYGDATAIDDSAMLEVRSNGATDYYRGFLPPRMTAGQRDSITSPARGLMIYNTDTDEINVYNGAWKRLAYV